MKYAEWEKIFESYTRMLKSVIPFWEHCYLISQYQKGIFRNYLETFLNFDLIEQFFRLAPTNLTQSINPWSFSLIQFTKEIKGSPALEYKILTEVSGYGSQLSKIIDFLEIIEKEKILKPDELSEIDKFKINKFKELVMYIKRAKGIVTEPDL
jgi:hypothetical protein